MRIVLASGSPRRRKILEEMGVRFDVISNDVDESIESDLLCNPAAVAQKIAERKAAAAVEVLADENFRGEMLIISADTIVVHNGQVYGKPADTEEAYKMLKSLSNSVHDVITGVSLWLASASNDEDFNLGFRSFSETTQVFFKDLSDEDIYGYLALGEHVDKAGSYAIQGAASKFVSRISGCRDNVIGLPSTRLKQEFSEILQI